MNGENIEFGCRHYRASRPCVFNKLAGSECGTCRHVSLFRTRVLFIKLDAIGDVLRSACLLPAVIGKHDAPYVAWVTRRESVALVGMMEGVDEVIELSEAGLARIMSGAWDRVYSLSNDVASASLASVAGDPDPVGYSMRGGRMVASNAAARRWLEMAAFDRVKQANTVSYQQLMLDILEVPGPFVRPALRVPDGLRQAARARVGTRGRRIVAVNVGSGGRWPKKMLEAEQIVDYIAMLLDRTDVDVLLVGGAAEAEKTAAILARCGDVRVRAVLTPDSIPEFVAVLQCADVLFCGDTLALHIATAVGLPAVAVFGPTSQAEIADFDGLIRKTSTGALDCLGCYGDCDKAVNCMTALDVGALVTLTEAQLARPARAA